MQQISKQPAFELGQIVATPGALAALRKSGQQPGEFLTRHVNREWGDLSDEDRKENDYSLEHGFRLLSSYGTNATLTFTDSPQSTAAVLEVSWEANKRERDSYHDLRNGTAKEAP